MVRKETFVQNTLWRMLTLLLDLKIYGTEEGIFRGNGSLFFKNICKLKF